MTSSTCGRLLLVLLLLRPAAARADSPAPPEALTVEDAVRIALENHPSVGAARAQRRAAGYRAQQAWAPMLPALTGFFAYQPQTANFVFSPGFARTVVNTADDNIAVGITRQCAPDDDACAAQAQPCVVVPGQATGCFAVPRARVPNIASLFSFYQSQVGIYWNLFDFGRSYYGARSAGEAATTFERAEEATALQVELDVRVAFYNGLAAEELVAVAAESLATQRKHLEQMRAFVEVGTRTKVDLAQARADHASAQLQLAQARGQRDTSMALLHDALGLESWRDFRLVPPPDEQGPVPAAEALDTLLEEAVAARPEVKQLEAQARAAEQQRKSIRGAWFPALTLTAAPSFAGIDISSLTPNFNLTLQIGYPALGMNPYLVLNQGREAEANVGLALEQARLTRNRVRLEAAQSLAVLRSAREAVAAAELLVEAATERRELQSGRFEAGLGTVLELQDAEFAYVNARGQKVQASYTLRIAGARLERALGR